MRLKRQSQSSPCVPPAAMRSEAASAAFFSASARPRRTALAILSTSSCKLQDHTAPSDSTHQHQQLTNNSPTSGLVNMQLQLSVQQLEREGLIACL